MHDAALATLLENDVPESQSLSQLGHEFGVPVAMGVLTCNTVQQAEARAGGNRGNKGVEATQAAIDMLRLIDGLKS